ncbi:hypothetical protein Agub_g14229 [Astrephomene gubernaculifera]|uniref:Protein kinase domain-containing protein n=1 Tax=Astrephomene gubernaculifera TaxID=47775 RepID=A0AAD3E3P2_9CHLO|nr:hypothetical protein Agub_g14229 [Astrephomene gubernaculifera]
MPFSQYFCCSVSRAKVDANGNLQPYPRRSVDSIGTPAASALHEGTQGRASTSGPIQALKASALVTTEGYLPDDLSVPSPFIRGSATSSIGVITEDAADAIHCAYNSKCIGASAVVRPTRVSMELTRMPESHMPASPSDPVAESLPDTDGRPSRLKFRLFRGRKLAGRGERGPAPHGTMPTTSQSVGGREPSTDNSDTGSLKEPYDDFHVDRTANNCPAPVPPPPLCAPRTLNPPRQPPNPTNPTTNRHNPVEEASKAIGPAAAAASAAATLGLGGQQYRRRPRSAYHSVPLPCAGADIGGDAATAVPGRAAAAAAAAAAAVILPAGTLSVCVGADMDRLQASSGASSGSGTGDTVCGVGYGTPADANAVATAADGAVGSVFRTAAAVAATAAAAAATAPEGPDGVIRGTGAAGGGALYSGLAECTNLYGAGVGTAAANGATAGAAASATALAPQDGSNSSPLFSLSFGGRSKLPYQASRHMSQVAFLQMYHSHVVANNAAGNESQQQPAPLVLMPPMLLESLNLTALSREITALRWIGQGGGGAVFQGVWQGAPVAVKFLLTDPAGVEAGAAAAAVGGDAAAATQAVAAHAAAIEGVLSTVVNHPNVVHTYAFECTRLTEASFAAALPSGGGSGDVGEGEAEALLYGRQQTRQLLPEQQGSKDLFETLLEEEEDVVREAAECEGAAAAAAQQQQQPNNQQNQPNAYSHLNLQLNRPGVLEATFQSDEGFGDPDIASCTRGWTVRHVLSYMKARPGMYLTHIIMEYCDRGSLLSAIKRGIFRMPGDDMPAAAAGGSNGGSGSGGGGGGGGGSSTSAAASQSQQQQQQNVHSSHQAHQAQQRFSQRVVLRAVLRTARDVAQGMCHLHANGIIHGDLKPGNVLLRGCRSDRRGFVAMVADFGLSKVTQGDKPLELNHWSTVTVMAPEVILGRWSKASDVFSFGILLWQLVTSEPVPYSKLTVPQILIGVSQGSLTPTWPPSAHPALVRLGRACLATNPEKRPSFEAIVKVLTKIEKNVRNELRFHPHQQQR